jgi:hypothetical protein
MKHLASIECFAFCDCISYVEALHVLNLICFNRNKQMVDLHSRVASDMDCKL